MINQKRLFEMKKLSSLKQNELKLLFDSGALKTGIIHRTRNNGEKVFYLSFVGKNHEVALLKTQRKTSETRYFKSLNAGARTLEEIGFKKFEVILD